MQRFVARSQRLRVRFAKDAFRNESNGLAAAQAARDAIWDSVQPSAREGVRVNWVHIYVASAFARALGLHDAIMREIREDNPHAVFPLCRTLADLALVTLEVRRDPEYVHVVARDPADAPKGARTPKKAQQLIAAARKEVPGMAEAWDVLSDFEHFAWASFGLPISGKRTKGALRLTVKSEPHWNPPDAKLVALQLVSTLSTIVAETFRKIFEEYPVGEPL